MPPAAAAAQSYEDIIKVLKSLPNNQLKGVRLEINAEFFGTDWAAGDEFCCILTPELTPKACPTPRVGIA